MSFPQIQGQLSQSTQNILGTVLDPFLLATTQQLLSLTCWLPLFVALLASQPKHLLRGLLALALLSLPILCAGNIWHPAMALGAFLVAYGARRWGVKAAEAIIAYALLAATLFAALNDAGGSTYLHLATSNFRALLDAALLAALADGLAANFVWRRTAPFVAPNGRSSIIETVRNGSNLLFIAVIAIPSADQFVSLTDPVRAAEPNFLLRHAELLLLLLIGALVIASCRIMFLRGLREMFEQTNIIARGLGTPAAALLPMPSIREMEAPVHRFVERNKDYMDLQAERQRFADVAADLERSVGLKLMRDIRFDEEECALHYVDVRVTDYPVREMVQVHPEDAPHFLAANGRSEAVIEFRPLAGAQFESLQITVHKSCGDMSWATGVLIQLHRPRNLEDVMAKQARLADLGSVASSIGHEIKQPLFTIAVAAESLRLLATKAQKGPANSQVLGRIERISEQVGRARDIIEHITGYGKPSQTERVSIDVAETVRRAHNFLGQMIEDQHIDVTIAIDEGVHATVMPQIELEQVFVNAIHNAVDAIVTRRNGGWTGQGMIALRVTSTDQLISCAVADNGSGLAPSIARSVFNAFFTTKADQGTGLGLYISRQIIERAGGSIALTQAEDGGAILAIELPTAYSEPTGGSAQAA